MPSVWRWVVVCGCLVAALSLSACGSGDSPAAQTGSLDDASVDVGEGTDATDAGGDAVTSPPDAAAEVAVDAGADAPNDVSACTCGDGACRPDCGETLANCPVDCYVCGDGKCSPGEGPFNCATDCCGGCGDGICKGYTCGENPKVCPSDCGAACGNKICDKGESPAICAEDCVWQVCGNGVCEPSDGGPDGCPKDCGATCGNCVCDKGEDWSQCPIDCGFCGDGVCSNCASLGESAALCKADCKSDACAGGCDDKVPCTKDVCTSDGTCVHIANAALCDDGTACTDDLCGGGGCIHLASAVTCESDGNLCTEDLCGGGACVHVANALACDDGNICTVGDACGSGVCAGSALDCNDQNVCTDDSCAPGLGCVHNANTQPCSDGNACTLGDVCSSSVCIPGTPTACSDDNPCTPDGCDPNSGACSHGPDTCDDGNACTDDACGLVIGCVHLPNTSTCTDGSACTIGDVCAGGACLPGAPTSCDDGNACTSDSCDPGSGVCSYSAMGCDDGNACTSDSCANPGGCAWLPIDGTCTDNNLCTTGDVCTAGFCTIGGQVNCDDGSVCTIDSCDPATGACNHLAQGASCSDNNACTDGDNCVAGSCQPGSLVDCNDDNACTTDSCDATLGCSNTAIPDGSACDDGLVCTTGETCTSGDCVGPNVTCPAYATCEEPAGCTCNAGSTCAGNVACPSGCVAIGYHDVIAAYQTVCAYDYPAWGAVATTPATFVDNSDGTISDSKSYLMWQKAADTQTWAGAQQACDNLTLAGYSDWRLPTVAELSSLIDYQASAQAIDGTFFQAPMLQTWTAMQVVNNPPYIWTVHFADGSLQQFDPQGTLASRCVRTASLLAGSSTRFQIDVLGDTIADSATGLTWVWTVQPQLYKFAEAKKFCANLIKNDGGWRVPTLREMQSLADFSLANPAANGKAFPGLGSQVFWTQTVYAPTPTLVWTFAAANGAGGTTVPAVGKNSVRCVR